MDFSEESSTLQEAVRKESLDHDEESGFGTLDGNALELQTLQGRLRRPETRSEGRGSHHGNDSPETLGHGEEKMIIAILQEICSLVSVFCCGVIVGIKIAEKHPRD